MGFRTFSFAEEFDEIRKFFLFFNLALSLVGVIALVTAALGIVNTMLMSISERRREIGILKSLGAEDGDVRRLFLVESGLIGVMGSGLGIALGEDMRAGRWWWEMPETRECGIHGEEEEQGSGI